VNIVLVKLETPLDFWLPNSPDHNPVDYQMNGFTRQASTMLTNWNIKHWLSGYWPLGVKDF